MAENVLIEKPLGRVGIMTFHWAANYGAVLQAWALQQHLLMSGYSAEIIDYVPKNHRIKLVRCFKTRHLCIIRMNLKAYKKEKKIRNFRKKHLKLSELNYSSNVELLNMPPSYDYYISGSDQIWNPYFTMNGQGGITLSYYLDFVPQDRHRIAFSSSFGCKTISREMEDAIFQQLSKFDHISTREKEGVEILRHMGIAGINTADPTFLLDAEEYMSLISNYEKTDPGLYVYMLHGQKEIAQTLIRNTSEKLRISLNEDDELTVEEWLVHIRDARFIITNSFHCVVFCLLFHIPFYVLDVQGSDMSSRLTTLLEAVGLEELFLRVPVSESDKALPDIDWKTVDARVESIRKHSRQYLKDTLCVRERVDNIPASRCTGCGLCTVICPKNCIVMEEDSRGFVFPKVDSAECIHCGACLNKCVAVNSNTSFANQPEAYAVWNKSEEIRKKSSSGGAFSAFAEAVIQEHGVVYGAKYVESLGVEHCGVERVEDLEALRGSKYMPSSAYRSYTEINTILQDGGKVLFCGTPCQVVALKNLVNDHPRLTCIDVACHGIPSMSVLRQKCESLGSSSKVHRIDFRNKESGWKDYSCVFFGENDERICCEIVSECDFLYGYIENLFIRESCEECTFAHLPRVGDLTIADCWIKAQDGSDKDDKGISAVLVNSDKGRVLFESALRYLRCEGIDLHKVIRGTPTLIRGSMRSNCKEQFWRLFSTNGYKRAITKYYGKRICKRKLSKKWRSLLQKKHG